MATYLSAIQRIYFMVSPKRKLVVSSKNLVFVFRDVQGQLVRMA